MEILFYPIIIVTIIMPYKETNFLSDRKGLGTT